MWARFRAAWQAVNASYWFYPGLFALGAILLAFLTIYLDRNGWAERLGELAWIQPARPEGASNMLTVIAGSMIGVASTVFSITIAAVAYASGNYGPRLLTNFMEDRGNQFSLATFIGTFVYALTVLRAVRTGEETSLLDVNNVNEMAGFVPQLSLLTAYILMAISIAVLVFFLNHIPASIRINSVLKGIGERLIADIQRLFPETSTGEVEMAAPRGRSVAAKGVGYVQRIDFKRLERIAKAAGGHIKLGVRTGDFVHPDVPLAYWADDDELDDLRDDEIQQCFTFGGMRTPAQDLHFLIDELVEIGLRALSPGINDPFTAITSIHWLGAATAELAHRDLVRTFNEDEDADADRLILLDDDFAHFVGRGFGAMRSALATSPTAARVAFDCLANAATTLNDASRLRVLRVEGEQLMRQARENLAGPDLEMIEARYAGFEEIMAG
ncbi:DUF2254 domain-containing protein [Erythrobacter litoralis]|uniref:DUF2254 domain-containing protein n=1 Tax=Erythrobacter litoralis (strain HTCC2594) TaxID=314225 RepID=Q2NDR2_ERYLH|nr:DUF2254 domain-containing protein [Erythrobacter litoralis]ABC62179.1 hypothetical protein ELI_00435 [Erythrobacter litoralis HTCC2594]